MARRGTGKRELILQTAARMLWMGSYGSISADHVCEEVGVNKGVFYHYFKSKEALLLAALDYNWHRVDELASQTLEKTSTDPMGRLMKFIRAVISMQNEAVKQSGCIPGCPLGNLAVELNGHSESIDQKIKDLFNRHLKLLKPVLTQIIGDRKADADFLALKLFTYLEGIFVVAKAYNDMALTRKLAREIPGFIEASITA